MGAVKELVSRQHQMLRDRDVSRVPDLYTPDAYFAMPGVRVPPHALPAVMNAYLVARVGNANGFSDVKNFGILQVSRAS
ncbi:MAG: hypothetical protein IT372_37235 [Polyangiaceae bacterium]|nr:hypothetical protein [Polyangiaceae bacterium]